jgi:hypothetical protein
MTPREQLTRRLLDELPSTHHTCLEQARITWWMNLRRDGGFRLSRQGFEILAQVLELQHWRLDTPDLTSADVLQLDKRLTTPYYLDQKRRELVLFGSREAMMAVLYADLKVWLSSLDQSR